MNTKAKQLQMNATKARKNFFGLLDQIVNNNVQVLVTKEGLDSPILLTKQKSTKKISNTTDQLLLVSTTAGSIETSGYKPDETELAKTHFVSGYKKKHGFK